MDQPGYNKRLTDRVVDFIGGKHDKPYGLGGV